MHSQCQNGTLYPCTRYSAQYTCSMVHLLSLRCTVHSKMECSVTVPDTVLSAQCTLYTLYVTLPVVKMHSQCHNAQCQNVTLYHCTRYSAQCWSALCHSAVCTVHNFTVHNITMYNATLHIVRMFQCITSQCQSMCSTQCSSECSTESHISENCTFVATTSKALIATCRAHVIKEANKIFDNH